MKKEIVMASMAMLLAAGASAQENENNVQQEQVKTEQKAEKKDGFFKRAFRDMKESARLQHKIDKANYEATKLESKAFYEEQKRRSNPSVRSAAEKARMEQELEAANERKAAAKAKLDSIKQK